MLEKSLRKMGFFVVILFFIVQTSNSTETELEPTISSLSVDQPIILPPDQLWQASSVITGTQHHSEAVIGQELMNEETWRSNIYLFMYGNNTNNTFNITNNMTF